MFYKVLLILACTAGAATLVSCAVMKQPSAPGETWLHSTTRSADSTEPTLDTAIEMILDGRYADASKLLEPLIVGYESAKDSHRAAESTFWLGYCKEKSGNSGDAAACYRRVIERYPQTDAARNAQDRLDGLGPQP